MSDKGINKEIAGSLGVGGNIAVGGNSAVRGNQTVDHNLIVKGWLDAPNIKGVFKGLFQSESKLALYYPRPGNGWFALVGDTIPASIYRAEGGQWTATGESGGTFVVDMASYNEAIDGLRDDVSGLKDDLDSTDTTLSELAAAYAAAIPTTGIVTGEMMDPEVYGDVIHLPLVIRPAAGGRTIHRVALPAATATKTGLYDLNTRKAVDNAVKAADDRAITAQATADAAMTNADDAINFAERETKAISSRVGAAGGIAPLNSSGLVDARFLPSYVDDIVEFNGRVDGDIDIEPLPPAIADMDGSETVVYNTFHARFLLRLGGRYYKTWTGYETYGSTATAGVMPVTGKIYVDTANDTLNRWSGSGLRGLPAVLALGTQAGQAFPGDQGAALERSVNALTYDAAVDRRTALMLSGCLPPVKVNGTCGEARQKILDINLPAGQTYELEVSYTNVTRLDMRVLGADNATWTWVLFKIPVGSPARFTLPSEGIRVAFASWDDTDGQAAYSDEAQFITTFTLRRVEPWELAAEAQAQSQETITG